MDVTKEQVEKIEESGAKLDCYPSPPTQNQHLHGCCEVTERQVVA